jgi:hypothetical protein
MNNYKLFKLLACFFLFQATVFTANAQCDNITLEAESTAASCYNDGTITVTIGGSDLSTIDLNTLEISLTAEGPGQSVDFSVWSNVGGNPAKKIYTQVVKGNYIVKIRFHCQAGPDWYASSVTTTVLVGGSYDPLVTTVITSRKSMTCTPTGVVVVNFTNGRPPYSGTISGPSGYTGQTTFNTSASSLTLGNNDCPAGDYSVTVQDNCNYGGTYAHKSPALDNDVVSTLYNTMARKSGSSDCRTIVPYGINYVYDASDNYYWTNYNLYYEYAYTLGSSTPPAANSSEWKTLNTKTPDYLLSQNYKDFCGNSPVPTLYSHIRPKGCSSTVRTQSHSMFYICPSGTGSNIFSVTTYDGSTCSSAKLSAYISYYYGVCYPAKWKITPTSDLNDIRQSGTLNDAGYLVTDTQSIDYPRGVNYTITLTDADGKVFTYPWSLSSNQGQSFTASASYLVSSDVNCMVYYGFLYTTATIAPGTKIKYVDGPIQTLPCDLSLNNTYTIPPTGWLSSSFYFTNTDPNSSTTATFQAVPSGDYKFEIINSCNYQSTMTVSMYVWDIDPMVYSSERTCGEGFKVTFPDLIYMVTPTGSNSYTSYTCYRIIAGPPGYTVNNSDYVLYGNPLTLPIPGTYTIGAFYYSSLYCDIATTTVEYPDGGLYIDPELTAAYACDDFTPGYIRVEAINGVEPYTYTVTSAPGTTPITLQSNNTGIFNPIGTAGGTYIINVKDACNTEFDIPVNMLSMTHANIVYTSNDGKFCNGTEIELNCVSLGSTTYEWRGPDGVVFSTDQRPRPIANSSLPPNSSAGSSGIYSVTVTPEGCTTSITQSLVIQAFQPQSPTVTNSTPSTIVNSGNVNVVTLSGAVASLVGYSLKWYDNAGTVISAPTAVSTASLGSTVYYVSQVDASGCESENKQITFTVFSHFNSLRVNPLLRSFFYP